MEVSPLVKFRTAHVTATKINSDVAGNGLSKNGTNGSLDVNKCRRYRR